DQIPPHAVEELPDVQIDHPVVLPAALPARPRRVQLRPAGPVPVGVRLKHRFHRFLQPGRGHGLRDPVRDARHPEHAGPAAVRLRYLHRHHRRREVGPRGHPVPDPVQIVLQIRLERLDGLPVHPRCTLIPFHLEPGVPDLLLRDPERLARCFQLVHATPPSFRRLTERTTATDDPAPSLRPRYRGFSTTTGRSAGVPAATVLTSLRGTPGSGTPSRRTLMRQFPGTPSHVPHGSRRPGSRHLCAGHRLASKRDTRQAHPGERTSTPVLMSSEKLRRFGSGRLPGPCLTHLVRLFLIAHHDGWTPTGFVDTIRSGTMVYEERTGSGTGSQEVHPGI